MLIIFQRKIPPKLAAIERLLLRISNQNSDLALKLQQQYKAIRAGYQGELIVDHFVRESNIKEPFVYWPNAEIQVTQHRHVQLDALIVAPNFSCIFEVKNMRGSIKFLEKPFQLSQSVEGEEKIFECPQSQIIRASNSIRYMFDQCKVKLPIYSKIIFSNSKTHIQQPPTLVDILFPKQISNFLEQLAKKPNLLSKREFERLVHHIEGLIKPFNPFPLSKTLEIKDQIIEGIICLCGNSIDLSNNSYKHCPICGCPKGKFIEQAMYDWFTIFQKNITNEECRNFLGIKNNVYISKLFANMNLDAMGNTRNRVYYYNYEKPLFKSGCLYKKSI
jgi:hypothetical protein